MHLDLALNALGAGGTQGNITTTAGGATNMTTGGTEGGSDGGPLEGIFGGGGG
jgi:hypothetical protein